MERENLKSRLGFILLSAGCAIGIGNVWKFPYMAGQGGGGRPNMAQAGGKNPAGIPAAIAEASKVLEGQLA